MLREHKALQYWQTLANPSKGAEENIMTYPDILAMPREYVGVWKMEARDWRLCPIRTKESPSLWKIKVENSLEIKT